jgi:diguanylate cyclase (GGDEF)-like protein
MRLFPSSLRSRLLVLVGLAVVPAMILIVFIGMEQRQEHLAEAEHNAIHLVDATAKGIQEIVLRTKLMLSLLGKMPQIRNQSDFSECDGLFAGMLGQESPYANVGLIRMDGAVACSALPFSSDVRLNDRAYFKRAIEARDFVAGNFQVGRITHEESINFAYPVLDKRQRPEGVLYAALPLRWIYQHLIASDLPDEATANVIDPSNHVLLSIPDQEGKQGRSLAGTAMIKAIMASGGKGIARLEDKDGLSRAYVFTNIPGLPKGEDIYISIGLPISYIYAKADRQTERNIAILVAFAGLAFLIALKGGDVFILKQVGLLLGATRQLTEGRLDARAPVIPHGGELSELASSFNGMAETLEQHTRRIYRLNRVYAVLSSINGTILRVRDRNELLQEACRIAVENGQFKLAWIGLADEAGQFLQPIAYKGNGEEYIRDMRIPLQKNGGGIRMAARVFLEDKDIIINDIGNDPTFVSQELQANEHGFYSAAAFALRVEGEPVGTFCLYAGEPGFFDQQELRLLRELAADTSLGLEIIGKEDRLYDLAHFDSLTNLPNRHEFEARLRLAIVHAESIGESVAVLAIKIDRLRHIRDALGRQAGDEALRTAAKHLSTLAGKDATVARIGTDDFGVILPDVASSMEVAETVDELLKDFPHLVHFQDDEFALNVHIGTALYPQDGEEAVQLTKNAELAMHQAPTSTKEYALVFFSEDMQEQVRKQRRLEQQLRHAIERNELELHYQPVVDIGSRMIMGSESLLRWSNAELGDISPADFIPVAEASGLIVTIGEWVFERAFEQSMAWSQRGIPFGRIVVNVSAIQLIQPDFPDRIQGIMRSVGSEKVDLMLGIEVTESQLMDNIEQAMDVLTRLKAMGFSIYIDDFGTGYSSLSYLRKLPVDILKVDISFIRDIEHDPDAISMTKGIIALAHSLDLRVIAEGVETAGQLSILEDMGCDYVQGYLLSRPGTAAQIEKLMGKQI